MTNRSSFVLGWLAVAATAGACGSTDGNVAPDAVADADADGGAVDASDASRVDDPDAGTVSEAGPIGTQCALTEHGLQGKIGIVGIDLDTRGRPPGSLDIGARCDPPATPSVPRPAQIVVAYRAPSEGTMGLTFSTANMGTDASFDTIVQLRRAGCDKTPVYDLPGNCFDDSLQGPRISPQSEGSYTVEAGETVFLVVTGASKLSGSRVSAGKVRIEVKATPNKLPGLTSATYRVVDDGTGKVRSELSVTGGDADGNARGAFVTFLDAAGARVDLDGDAVQTFADRQSAPFDSSVAGKTTFTASATSSSGDPKISKLKTKGAASARVVLVDTFEGVSPTAIDVPIAYVTEAAVGATCGGAIVCSTGYTCSPANVCAPSPALVAACAGATALAVPVGSAVRATGTVPAGPGLFRATCSQARSAASLYRVVVPDDGTAYDLVARTDVAGTSLDSITVVSVRADCADDSPPGQRACSTNVGAFNNPPDSRSKAVAKSIAPGTYTVVVGSGYTASPLPYTLDVSLRPVLAAGATCDPAEVADRCATAACPAATSACP